MGVHVKVDVVVAVLEVVLQDARDAQVDVVTHVNMVVNGVLHNLR